MSVREVGLVTVKELRETLRDRRTIMVMVLFPLVVYPLVSLLMAQVMAGRVTRAEASRSRVAVTGEPAGVAAVASRLRGDPAGITVEDVPGAGPAAIESGKVDAVVDVAPARGAVTDVRVIFDETREASGKARDRVSHTLGGVLPLGCNPTFHIGEHGIAPSARVGGYVLSKILPLVVVVMVMLGAFYPAIDITAGERERGTLETILSAPVNRFSLMAGKVLAVATLAAITGILNMASMSLTMLEGVRLIGVHADLSIPWSRAASTLVVLVPTAFLFASVMVAIGAMARSFKEAQTLLTPVYFLCFTPSLIAGLGDYELSSAAALAPGVNVTLLARDLMLGRATPIMIAAVVASTLCYGALAMGLAARLYDSERLLAADDGAGRMPLGAWLRRLLLGTARQTAAEPKAAHALGLYALACVLLFYAFPPIQAWRFAPGLLISEWVGLFGLVFLYARGTGQRMVAVMRLQRARPRAILGAVLIGSTAWAVVGLPTAWILPVPKELIDSLRRMVAPVDGSRSLPFTLFLMALTPAICEEALFRGPILRGFARSFRPLGAALLTGLLFGLFHANLWRLLPAGALGVVLSLIALASDSIIPAMIAHFTNNACLVVLARFGVDDTASTARVGLQVGLFLTSCAIFAVGALLVRGSDGRRRNLPKPLL
jgi:sodium transport system permease protein